MRMRISVCMNKISILKKLNKKAIENGDVPVSCIIEKNNEIIATGYNMREKNNNPLLHAEIVAIQKAAKKLKTWNLSDCNLLVTLKPCDMCVEVIKMAKIKKIDYILENEKIINNKLILNKINIDDQKYFINEIKDFFADKR